MGHPRSAGALSRRGLTGAADDGGVLGGRQHAGAVLDGDDVEIVEARLAEAAEVIRRLPPVRVPGYFNTWPPMIVEFADRIGQQAEPMRLPPPSPTAISRMEETLGWLRWLNPEHAKLVWARAEHTPWKLICWRFGIARATAHRRWQYGLSLIAYRLNGRRLSEAVALLCMIMRRGIMRVTNRKGVGCGNCAIG